ncbi:MAG: hypothetical protein ACFFAN_09430 [Promethearchaeota archaeon]
MDIHVGHMEKNSISHFSIALNMKIKTKMCVSFRCSIDIIVRNASLVIGKL